MYVPQYTYNSAVLHVNQNYMINIKQGLDVILKLMEYKGKF